MEDMISGKDRLKAPSKIVKENVAKLTDEDYAANNTSGIVTNQKAAYNIKQAKWGTGKRSYKEEDMTRRRLLAIFKRLGEKGEIKGGNTDTMRTFISKYHAEKNLGDLNKMGKSNWRDFLAGKRDRSKRVEGTNMILFESFIDDYNKKLGIECLNG